MSAGLDAVWAAYDVFLDNHGGTPAQHRAYRAAIEAEARASQPLTLDVDEQAAMDDLLAFMAKMSTLGLSANRSEMVMAIHVLQGFVVQHMLGRLVPDAWSSWFKP